MPSATLAKRVTRVYSAEQWAEARRSYERGLSLEGVAEKLGIQYSTIQNHAWVESWPVRSRGGQRDPRYQAAKARRMRRKLEKEERRLEQDLALVKTEDLELLARRSLAADSARAKVAVSRRVTEIVSRLADPSIPVWSAAQALGSLAPIFRLVWGWGDREADMQRMKRAVTSCADAEPRTAAVNLALIATTPEQLAAMAKAKSDRDDDHDDDRATECNRHGAGPSVVAPEQPPAATHGRPIPQKEAPKRPPEGQPAGAAPAGHSPVSEEPRQPPDWFDQIAHPAPLSQTPFGQTPQNSFSRSPSWHEHRKANWEKYREKGR